MTHLNLAAIDLGAESGRVMHAQFDGRALALTEAHRFPNIPVRVGRTLHWDVLRLFGEIKSGLRAAARSATAASPLRGIAADTWGVDFALLDASDALIGNPVHYRDARTDGMQARVFAQVPRDEIFQRTGIQFMQINTLYHLAAMAAHGDHAAAPALAQARAFLTIPDLLHFWLSGVKANEYTNASTTQCLDVHTRDWDRELLAKIGVPTAMFGQVIQPATLLGPLSGDIGAELGPIPVIAPASHDTGSAVLGAPLSGPGALYLSSGTWSLMGVEADAPVLSARAREVNVTNEGGAEGTIRLLKNIMGLWLLQECRRSWAAQGREYDYATIEAMARSAQCDAFVMASDDRFLAPPDMPEAIRAACLESGQAPPASDAELARCVLNSLALEYRWVADRLGELTGRALDTIHIIGGGSQNALLNQLTADATGRAVIAGPVEATTAGNAVAQLKALGEIASFAEGRNIVRHSFGVRVFEPLPNPALARQFERFLARR